MSAPIDPQDAEGVQIDACFAEMRRLDARNARARELARELVDALRESRRFIQCNNSFSTTIRADALAKIDQLMRKIEGEGQ